MMRPYVSRAPDLRPARLRAHFSSTGGFVPAGHVEYRDLRLWEDRGMRTIQLRRYTLVDGEYDAFLAWWEEWMPRVRPAAGFAIEFAYGLRETNEFVWAVSADGDQDAFLATEQAYMASPEPAEAFDGVPQRVAAYNVRLRRRRAYRGRLGLRSALPLDLQARGPIAGSGPPQPPIADRIAAATRVSRAAMSASGCGSDR